MAGTEKFFVSKNQFCHANQPCKGIFKKCFVFSHFFVRSSNGRQYSNFENKCPKLGTGTPDDMVLTNLGETLDSDPSGFVLIYMFYFRRPKYKYVSKNSHLDSSIGM